MFIEVSLLSVSTNCRKDVGEDEGAVEVTVSVSSEDEDIVGDAATILSD